MDLYARCLGKDKKKVDKSAASQQAASAAASTASFGPLNISEVELRAAIETVKKEELPASPEAKEQYFMQQVNMGETLCAQGKFPLHYFFSAVTKPITQDPLSL